MITREDVFKKIHQNLLQCENVLYCLAANKLTPNEAKNELTTLLTENQKLLSSHLQQPDLLEAMHIALSLIKQRTHQDLKKREFSKLLSSLIDQLQNAIEISINDGVETIHLSSLRRQVLSFLNQRRPKGPNVQSAEYSENEAGNSTHNPPLIFLPAEDQNRFSQVFEHIADAKITPYQDLKDLDHCNYQGSTILIVVNTDRDYKSKLKSIRKIRVDKPGLAIIFNHKETERLGNRTDPQNFRYVWYCDRDTSIDNLYQIAKRALQFAELEENLTLLLNKQQDLFTAVSRQKYPGLHQGFWELSSILERIDDIQSLTRKALGNEFDRL